MTYAESVARAVKYDGLTGDHIPSIAAIQKNVENTLGRSLSEEEYEALRNNTNTVVVGQDLHAAGRTYFGANTSAQVAEEATDLSAAALKDQATHLENAGKYGYDVGNLQNAFDQLNRQNQILFSQLSTKQGILQFFQKFGAN